MIVTKLWLIYVDNGMMAKSVHSRLKESNSHDHQVCGLCHFPAQVVRECALDALWEAAGHQRPEPGSMCGEQERAVFFPAVGRF